MGISPDNHWCVEKMEASLRDMLKHGRKFERMRIGEDGLFVRKIPKYKDEPAYIALEVNPSDEGGSPMERIGIIIRSKEQLDGIRELLATEAVEELIKAIEEVNSHQA